MKLLFFTLTMALLLTICFADININLEFTLPKLNNGLTNFELYDYNEDGIDEIFGLYNGSNNSFMLACYSSIGDTIFTNTFPKETDNEVIRKFKILNESQELLVISLFTNDFDELYSRITIYDLNDLTLLTSISNYLDYGLSLNSINVTFLTTAISNDDLYIFAVYEEDGIFAHHSMSKYIFDGLEIIFLEAYNNNYSSFKYDISNNIFYSAEFHHNYEFDSSPGGYTSTEDNLLCEVNSYSNDLESQVLQQTSITGFMHDDSYGEFYAIDYPLEYKLFVNNLGYSNESNIVFSRIANNGNDEMSFVGKYQCFDSDFSEVIWEQYDNEVSQNWLVDDLKLFTFIILDQEEYIVNSRYNNEITVRNLENGTITISDNLNFNPFVALTRSDNTTIFIEQVDNFYNAYTLNFVTSNNDNITNSKEYVYMMTNYPNPFNPTTTISFSLLLDSDVSVEVYNVKGQKVKTLVNEKISAGQHSVIWNGDDDNNILVSSGVYFYRIETDYYQQTKKMIMLK